MERAQYIMRREDELAMEVLQARYEATQNGADPAAVANLSTSQMMREDLGDTDYEKYLDALGRPTTINVREVLTNSPAQAAGLAPGDEIVGYDGKRVFDMNELTGLTYEGGPGSTVAIDVLRNGQPMQLYVERGPIGVSGGGRSTRRRP
jgi:S1-C subfamily serine protease